MQVPRSAVFYISVAKYGATNTRVASEFMEFMEQHMPRMRDIPDVGHFLLAALAEAHQIVLASGVKDPEGEAYVTLAHTPTLSCVGDGHSSPLKK